MALFGFSSKKAIWNTYVVLLGGSLGNFLKLGKERVLVCKSLDCEWGESFDQLSIGYDYPAIVIIRSYIWSGHWEMAAETLGGVIAIFGSNIGVSENPEGIQKSQINGEQHVL